MNQDSPSSEDVDSGDVAPVSDVSVFDVSVFDVSVFGVSSVDGGESGLFRLVGSDGSDESPVQPARFLPQGLPPPPPPPPPTTPPGRSFGSSPPFPDAGTEPLPGPSHQGLVQLQWKLLKVQLTVEQSESDWRE
jgi:hypothetical protein